MSVLLAVDWLNWSALVAVPLIGTFFTWLGIKTYSSSRRAEDSSAEAAKNVRPNGTGHQTQTAMIEDVLLHLGEIRGEVKSVSRNVYALTKEVKDLKVEFKEHLDSTTEEQVKRTTQLEDEMHYHHPDGMDGAA